MDSQRFDALTRWVGGAGSRRQIVAGIVAGAVARVLPGGDAVEVAAACKGFNAQCEKTANCCASSGLRCVKVGKDGKGKKKRRCRCKSGTCPPQTPCCLGGACEELCDDACCGDCFVLITGDGVPPAPNSDECCPQDKVCGRNPKKQSDDRCCFEFEECVDGECCRNNGSLGSIVCGGECCPQDACCNGACCQPGQVCAETPTGDQCVSAARSCNPGPDCFSNEACLGGTCCAENRQCSNAMGNSFCCPAGQYCELPGGQTPCCAINETCNSFKGHRVRR